jgi:hypothetical protein
MGISGRLVHEAAWALHKVRQEETSFAESDIHRRLVGNAWRPGSGSRDILAGKT